MASPYPPHLLARDGPRLVLALHAAVGVDGAPAAMMATASVAAVL